MWASTLGCPAPSFPLSCKCNRPRRPNGCASARLDVQPAFAIPCSMFRSFCASGRCKKPRLPIGRSASETECHRTLAVTSVWAQTIRNAVSICNYAGTSQILHEQLAGSPGWPASGAGQSPTWLSTRYRGATVATANHSRRLGGYNRNIPHPSAARPADLLARCDASAGPYLSRTLRIAIPPVRWSWLPCGRAVAWTTGSAHARCCVCGLQPRAYSVGQVLSGLRVLRGSVPAKEGVSPEISNLMRMRGSASGAGFSCGTSVSGTN